MCETRTTPICLLLESFLAGLVVVSWIYQKISSMIQVSVCWRKNKKSAKDTSEHGIHKGAWPPSAAPDGTRYFAVYVRNLAGIEVGVWSYHGLSKKLYPHGGLSVSDQRNSIFPKG